MTGLPRFWIWGAVLGMVKSSKSVKKPRITKKNIRMAKETLDTNASLAAIGVKYGVSRACVWQNLKRFCKHFMFDHEKLDNDGNLKNLKGLRRAWRSWHLV